jgi:hypothetical protein
MWRTHCEQVLTRSGLDVVDGVDPHLQRDGFAIKVFTKICIDASYADLKIFSRWLVLASVELLCDILVCPAKVRLMPTVTYKDGCFPA